MSTNNLTDNDCKKAKSAGKAVKLFDGGGLHLFVSPKGAKVWRLAFRLKKKPQTISFGFYPSTSLADARRQRDTFKAELAKGFDPRAETAKVKMTLLAASAAYWAGRLDVSDSYRTLALRGIELHLGPKLGQKDVGTITREDLLAKLLVMDAKGLLDYVRKVRIWVGMVFDWAVERSLAKVNPAALIDPKKAFSVRESKGHAALTLKEMPEFMARLSFEQPIQSVLACRLLALTWVRTTELREMTWGEVDVPARLWTIPVGRMKRKRVHLIPLSDAALAIIETMRQRSRGSDYIFPNDRRSDRPMSENAVLYMLGRIGYGGRMTGHGWRSVASTWANQAGYNPDAIERQLSHSPDDKVRAAYNRAEYMEIRTQMMTDWAAWLAAQEKPPAPVHPAA
jgi:integrase